MHYNCAENLLFLFLFLSFLTINAFSTQLLFTVYASILVFSKTKVSDLRRLLKTSLLQLSV